MKALRLLRLLLYSIVILFFGVENGAAFNYLPLSPEGSQTITYTQFTLSYNEEHEQPNWVAYEITVEEVAMQRDRCDCFEKDDAVLGKSATKADYRSSGFDRGHMCPAAVNNMSEEANRESFLMSNMSPQLPSFNRGIWADLEAWVRNQVEIYGILYVVTGPVFKGVLGAIGDNEVTIPGYFYKVLLRFDDSKPRTIAFLLPHVGATGEIKDYVVPVNTIETLTGLDFFPSLENSIENRVEAQYQLKKWGF
ncbi:DNA/RNA non-specific endonuclease [Desulforhopalus singaporensis]|uniref:Endonuclease n=1 Tax=Desulforhopalus singaporensis TaxID=91360 RepID=A0A1H0W0L6_9BACT|nr:DNA/RNA non-specific endonuclease [Desulforhopalus singaporensis]SDP84244.1 endonuclease G [Desulforhopalus singaporensis]